MNAIELSHLSKNYGKVKALNDINLTVPEGAIYGVVGSNGAGKTTLIKALVGSVRPTEGSAIVLGLDPLKEKWKLRKQIGYMPQSASLYDDLSARDNIRFFGKAQPILNLEDRIEELIQLTDLKHRENDKVGTFSGGMKKRVSLCCAMVHNPRMLFLDEPTAAIDPHLKIHLWSLFRKLSQSGVTIFISTHQMDEVMLCDHVAILHNGELIAENTPQQLIGQGKTRIVFRINDERKSEIANSNPESIAESLHLHGLDESISAIDIQPDRIENIILAIMDDKGKGAKS